MSAIIKETLSERHAALIRATYKVERNGKASLVGERYTQARRVCLGCQEMFKSRSSGNRICKRCAATRLFGGVHWNVKNEGKR